MKYAISYVSTASSNLGEEEIQKILDYSRNWNMDHHITGILLYSEGNFFQVLEGEKQLVEELFKRIKNDARHYDIIKIFSKDIVEERFTGYKADFISVDSRYRENDLTTYLAQIDKLNPGIQTSVKYILKNFSEGIK
ncbi:BLUF domain-containing protein [Antarcticibacterium flavum]|uniref:BLUF domain-containing protein n=1 Tax=Antarcticibacterium flavum TaxID=2058175 RepID=A0A5B7X2T8_9FLAO|nr:MULTISPECIES: BLUF domain-containing protein [Antarcticibacterium]MCM4160938.1 blue light sensor protein [Antarcticibacterium sp. W02-3]QCY68981.1 BLUF domain-containing protein [Antarcticibacterium flavum]